LESTEPGFGGERPADIRGAIAEALHVDGEFTAAAAMWIELATERRGLPESALKAAIAAYAAGDNDLGETWLARAAAAGADQADLSQVVALTEWNVGRRKSAIARLRRAIDEGPLRSAFGHTTLGAILWQCGRRDEARREFAEALNCNPHDPFALLDTAAAELAANRLDCVEPMLAAAARHLSHRPEPFVFYSRLCRTVGRTESAQEALVRARLRRCNFVRDPDRSVSMDPPAECGAVHVRGRIGPDGVDLRLHYRVPGQHIPSAILANSAYGRIRVGSRWVLPAPAAQPTSGSYTGLLIVPLPADLWQQVDGDRVLDVEVHGMPSPPCVRFETDWFEVGGESGWLPLPSPNGRWSWTVDLEAPPGFVTFLSTDRASDHGIGVIAIRQPARLSMPAATRERPIEVVGRMSPATLRRAGGIVAEGIKLWSPLLGTSGGDVPPVVVLHRPDSSFCYCRPGYIRVASGVLADDVRATQLYHEAGHYWWGCRARFAPNAYWLAEALAEYSLHLAEDAGLARGYAAETLSALQVLEDGRLPDTGLARLGEMRGRAAQYHLRAKGGFVVAMLARIIGSDAFRGTLADALAFASERPLDPYVFFAIASRRHNHSLNWFVNQWINVDAWMTFSVRDLDVSRAAEDFRTCFTFECTGWATPGAPVDVLLRTGQLEQRASVDVNLGATRVALTTVWAPTELVIDPEHRWYANVSPRVVRIRP
jgi:hypothetical protein